MHLLMCVPISCRAMICERAEIAHNRTGLDMEPSREAITGKTKEYMEKRGDAGEGLRWRDLERKRLKIETTRKRLTVGFMIQREDYGH